jgi:hypothetical protein
VSARPAAAPSSTRWSNVNESVQAGRALTDLVSLLQDGGRLRALPA